MAHKYPLSLALAASLALCGCTSTTKAPTIGQPQSFTDKMSANVKNGTSRFFATITPKKTPATASEASPSSKPRPSVFVAAAQMHETNNNYPEAEANYRKALELDPHNEAALVGFARLEDRHGNFEAATKYYQRAIRKHPRSASVRNDLGLCYHRRGMLPEATRELKKAVELDGESKLYRNNLAAAYVEQNDEKEAYKHLSAVHGTSNGHYNLAYLLTQKQDTQKALYHFQKAAEIDPNNQAAREWVARLTPAQGPYAMPAGGQATMAQQQYQAAYQPPTASATYTAGRVAPEPGQQYAPQKQYAPQQQHAPQQQYAPPQGQYAPQGYGQPQQRQPGDPMPPLPGR